MRLMRLPQIRIDQQFARIGISSRDAHVEINQGPAHLEIQQPNATMSITTRPARLTIDQTQVFRELGQFPAGESVARSAQAGFQKAVQGSGRRRRQGDQMMRIEHEGNPIALIAKENAPRQMRPFNIGFIPSHGSVDIHYEPAEVQVNNQANKPRIQASTTPVTQSFTPAQLDVYLEQQHYLNIDFDHLNYVGVQVSFEI